MLGKLAQKLRLLGLDVRYERNPSGITAYRQARAEGRVFLTRNRRLQRLPEVFFLASEKPEEQVVAVRRRLNFEFGDKEEGQQGVLSRCLVCNEVLARISRDDARPAIPFYIYQIHNDFRRCPRCKRVYWPGSHVQNMLKKGER